MAKKTSWPSVPGSALLLVAGVLVAPPSPSEAAPGEAWCPWSREADRRYTVTEIRPQGDPAAAVAHTDGRSFTSLGETGVTGREWRRLQRGYPATGPTLRI
jgi:hypothetical protein